MWAIQEGPLPQEESAPQLQGPPRSPCGGYESKREYLFNSWGVQPHCQQKQQRQLLEPCEHQQQQRHGAAGVVCRCGCVVTTANELSAPAGYCFSLDQVDCTVALLQQQRQQQTRELLLRSCSNSTLQPGTRPSLCFPGSNNRSNAAYRCHSLTGGGCQEGSGLLLEHPLLATNQAAAASAVKVSTSGMQESVPPLSRLTQLCNNLYSHNRDWSLKPLRSLDLPEALLHRHLSQPMDWAPLSRRFCTALLSSVYTATTDDTCAPIWEPMALWPAEEQQQHQQLHGFRPRGSEPFGLGRDVEGRISGAPPLQQQQLLPTLLSPNSARQGLPMVVPLGGPQPAGSPQGARRVTCVQFAAAAESLLALGFESGALEFWAMPFLEGAPEEGPPAAGAAPPHRVAAVGADTPGVSPCGSQQRSTLLQALSQLQQQRGCSSCSSWYGPSGGPEVTALAWHPKRPLLAAAHADGRVDLWDVQVHPSCMGLQQQPDFAAAAADSAVAVRHLHSFLFASPLSLLSPSIQTALGAPLPCGGPPRGPQMRRNVVVQGPVSLAWCSEGNFLSVGGKEGALLLWSLEALSHYTHAAAALGGPQKSPSDPLLLHAGVPLSPASGGGYSPHVSEEGAPGEGALDLRAPRLRGASSLKTLSTASTQPSNASPPDTPVGRDTRSPQQQQQQSPAAHKQTLTPRRPVEEPLPTLAAIPDGGPSLDPPNMDTARLLLLQSYLPHWGGPQLRVLAPGGPPSSLAGVQGTPGAPVSGAWLLGVKSVLQQAHGGKVRCVSFCAHDRRVLVSAGDTAAATAGAPAGPYRDCGNSKLKLWVVDAEVLQPKPLLQIPLDGIVTSMLWSKLTGELLLAHGWMRPCGGPLGLRPCGGPSGGTSGGSLPEGRGPGHRGRGGVTVWRYLGDGGRFLLRQQHQYQQHGGLMGGWTGPHGPPPCGECLAPLQPLLLKVGGFGDRPVPKDSSSSSSSNQPRTPTSAAAEATADGGPSASPVHRGGPQRPTRISPYSLPSTSVDPYSSWGGSFGGRQGGFLGSGISVSRLGSPQGSDIRPGEARRRGCYAETDNATSLVQSADGRVVAYWSLPAEIIAVWAFPPATKGAPFSGPPRRGPAGAGGPLVGAPMGAPQPCGSDDEGLWDEGPPHVRA